MPLRRWFAAHGMPPWYSWLVVVGLTVASIGLSTAVNLSLADRQIKAERAAREQTTRDQQKQAAAGQAATCAIILAQIDVYRETPPTTATGVNADQGWHDLSKLFHC